MRNYNIKMAILWYILAVVVGPTIVIFFEIKDILAAFAIGFGAGWIPAKIGTGYLFGDYDR